MGHQQKFDNTKSLYEAPAKPSEPNAYGPRGGRVGAECGRVGGVCGRERAVLEATRATSHRTSG